MTLLRCDINYYYGAFFSFFEKKNENFYDAFLECEKMALVGYDTNYYYFHVSFGDGSKILMWVLEVDLRQISKT